MQSKGLSRVFSKTTVQKHQYFGAQLSFREGNGNPLQYSRLENPVDGGAWWPTVHWVSTSWQIDGETMETVTDFIFLGSKINADGDCSHEIKRHLLLGRKVITNLD